MEKVFIFLLWSSVLMRCGAYNSSSLIKISARSLDISTALKQAAEILNVTPSASWSTYMDPTSTTGSNGNSQVGSDTLSTVMAAWSIPEQFRAQAVQNVHLLVSAATEGTFTAQTFVFDVPSGTSLSTLIIVTRRLETPSDPKSPVEIAYVTINSNANVKQQYTYYTVRDCHRCAGNLFGRKCCHDEQRSSPRGNTPEELEIIKNKIKADQYAWFLQQTLARTIIKRSRFYDRTNGSISLAEAMEKFLSNHIVKGQVLASYNDSVLSIIQSHIGLLKSSSQSLKLMKVARENVLTVLSSLAQEYGFEDDYISTQFSQQLETGRISYEKLFTSSSNESQQLTIKYIWIVGQSVGKSTYSINFLFANIKSQIIIRSLLYNETNISEIHYVNQSNEDLQVIRTSKLNSNGEFSQEQFLSLITPWKLQTTEIVLNILRFIGASALYPQKHRMLSYFDSDIIFLENDGNQTSVPQPRTIPAKIVALSKAISAAATAWKDVVTALKSSSSTTITRITRFGFNYFNQKSTVMKAMDIPSTKATEFINALAIDYNLPTKGSFTLGLTYSDDFAWDRIDYLYSPSMNGNYRSFTLFKNGDSLTNTASFFIVDIDANWQLAPDLLIIQTSKSYLGGIWETNKQSIQEVPHVLTLDEAVKLQQFFMLVAMGNIANTLSVNVTIPTLN